MARLPYVDPSTAPERVREVLDNLPQLNIFKMMANAETTFRPFLGLGTALLGSKTFDHKLRELVILHVGKLSDGRYEWHQHVPIAICLWMPGLVDALELGGEVVDNPVHLNTVQ